MNWLLNLILKIRFWIMLGLVAILGAGMLIPTFTSTAGLILLLAAIVGGVFIWLYPHLFR